MPDLLSHFPWRDLPNNSTKHCFETGLKFSLTGYQSALLSWILLTCLCRTKAVGLRACPHLDLQLVRCDLVRAENGTFLQPSPSLTKGLTAPYSSNLGRHLVLTYWSPAASTYSAESWGWMGPQGCFNFILAVFNLCIQYENQPYVDLWKTMNSPKFLTLTCTVGYYHSR